LRAVQEAGLTQLSDGLAGVQAARSDLSQAIADRRTLPPPIALDADAMQAILQSALSLDEFAAFLREQPQRAGRPARLRAARGTLAASGPRHGAAPVRGGRRGRRRAARGWCWRPASNALVTTPWPASVRYAGPLLDYGNVIILEPESGLSVDRGGLATVFVQAGDLLTGAHLGLMPGPATTGEELILPESQGGGAILSETLYLELRQAGRTVDPSDWFAVD
jgi:septal ring factor EnvC (AmiA/AmiB activator)